MHCTMNLAGCSSRSSPCCSNSLGGLGSLGRESLHSFDLNLSRYDVGFLPTPPSVRKRRNSSCHSATFSPGKISFHGAGAAVLGLRHRSRRRAGVARVGSVLRSLEKEDDTKEGPSGRRGRDEGLEDVAHGDENAPDGARPTGSATATVPGFPSHAQHEEIERHPGGAAAGPGPASPPGRGAPLAPAEEGAWRPAAAGGLGHANGAIQLRRRVRADENDSSKTEEPGVDTFEEEEEDESVNITRIPVLRQRYIAVSKVELVSSLLTLFPSPADASALLEVFACLESVLHAEHKSVLEELRMDYGLAHTPAADEKPSAESPRPPAGAPGEDDDPVRRNWWQKLAARMKGKGADGARPDGPPGRGRSLPPPVPPGVSDPPAEEATQREKAAVRFQHHFMRLLRSAQFEGLSVSDLKLTAALNSDYLLTLPIDVDWNSAASADALLFRRGYAAERQEGLLFGAKLDYLQSVMLSKIFSGLTGPLFRVGRWCIEKWESLEEDEEGRALAERIERWLEEPLQRAANQPARRGRGSSDYETSGSDTDDAAAAEEGEEEEGLEIWKAARQAVPRYEAVLSSAGSRGLLLRRVLVRMGILPPESPRLPGPPAEAPPAAEPYMRPKMLARVSMRDIWRPASKATCGNNPWKRLRAAFSIFFSRATLQEPAFEELVLLYNQSGAEMDENGLPRLQLHTYTNIPLPDLKVVFPNKKLSFRLIDTVRLDVATLAGLFAFFVSHKFDDLLSSPSAFALDVIASVSLLVYVARVALGYKQTADRYQLLVNKTLYEKTLASGFGVAHFLLDASEEQQFKGAALVFALLRLGGDGAAASPQKLADACERYLYNNFKEQVEMPMGEVLAVLLRLGLVVGGDELVGDAMSAPVAALPDGEVIAALERRWLALMSKQSIWSAR